MSCRWCIHFLGHHSPGPYKPPSRGHCTLNPAWVEVRIAHYCGQLKIAASTTSDGTTVFERWYEARERISSDQVKLAADQKKLATEKRLLAAEKKLLKLADATPNQPKTEN